jgi:tRNA-Thr(GGU) m(6)t(6)A37 methyltransferase TsaA
MEPVVLRPIGVVRGGRAEIFEDHWGPVGSRLILDPAVLDPDATLGLGDFSHLEVVFHFHRENRVRRGASFPRGNPAWPRVGVLAGRSPVRPNHLGVSCCELLGVAGLELTVRGLDAVDGSPILDIKPYSATFQPPEAVREPAWMRELMAEYY